MRLSRIPAGTVYITAQVHELIQVRKGLRGQWSREEVPPHRESGPLPSCFSWLFTPLFCYQFAEGRQVGSRYCAHGSIQQKARPFMVTSKNLWMQQGTLSVGLRPLGGMAQEWVQSRALGL